MRRSWWWKRFVPMLGLGALAAVACAASSLATTAPGTYQASISPASVRAGVTEASAGTPFSVQVTFTNVSSSSTAKLGSANATFPTGFTLVQGTASVSATGGAHWSAKVVGRTVQIRTPETSSNYLVSGKAVTATIKLTAAPTLTGPYTVATDAKSDGDNDNDGVSLNRSGGNPAMTVTPGPLDHFALGAIGAQVAGDDFDVTATAYDRYQNLKTDFSWATASVGASAAATRLGESPNHTTPAYGPFSPATGSSATAHVTAFKAESGRVVTVASGSVSKDSNTFDVSPGPFNLTFTNQPGLSEVATATSDPIFSDPVAKSPVTVGVADDWGNVPGSGALVTVSIRSGTGPAGAGLTGTLSQPTSSSGVATFADLKVNKTTPPQYQLQADVNAPEKGPGVSSPFDVVGDVKACSGTSCNSDPVSNPSNTQTTSSGLAGTSGSLAGSLLTTSFLTGPANAPTGACSGNPIGDGFDVAVQGGSPNSSKPTLTITLTLAPQLLVPGRQAWQYDVCLGAMPYPGSFSGDPVPWKTKTLANLFSRKPAVLDGGFYWGVVPACFWGSFDPFWISIPATNPCIESKSIGAGGLTIKLRKPWPWDGKGGIY